MFRQSPHLLIGTLMVCLAVFSGLWMHYYPFMLDDTYISLRYVNRFLQGKGLTWNDGEYIEGYSNLLWILLTALTCTITGLDPETSCRLLNLLLAAGCVIAYFRLVCLMNLQPIAAAGGVFFLICNIPFAVWTLAGLEVILYCCLLLCACGSATRYALHKDVRAMKWLGLWLGLLAICRPEGFTFIPVFLFSAWMARRELGLRPLFTALAIALAFLLAQIVFRLEYYGNILPNSYYLKVAYTFNRLIQGANYVSDGVYFFLPTLIYLVINLWITKPQLAVWKPYLRITLLPTLVWLMLLMIGGGDIFPAFRHLVPAIALASPAIAIYLHAILVRMPHEKAGLLYGFPVTMLVCFWMQWVHPSNQQRIKLEANWITKVLLIGNYLKEEYGELQPTVAVTAAGAIPYASELPSVDLFGLNDPYLVNTPPKNFGKGWIGHEFFDIDYLFWRLPEIVIIHDAVDWEWQMHEEAKYYYPVKISFPDSPLGLMRATLWYRLDFPSIKEKPKKPKHARKR